MDNFHLPSNYELSCKFIVIKWNSKFHVFYSYKAKDWIFLFTSKHNNLCLSVNCQLLGSEAIFTCMVLHFLKLYFYISWRHHNLGFKVHSLLLCLLDIVFIVRTGLDILNCMQKKSLLVIFEPLCMSRENSWISTAENMPQECC